jgi:UDP-N-acetylglucosamine enolpyruvyl transferase
MSTQANTDFWELRNILTLAAFAAEARRVLDDIEVISRGVPEFNESLSKLIDARRQ